MISLSPVGRIDGELEGLIAGLRRTKKKTGERWSVEFVLQQIMSGRCFLFRLHDGDKHLAYAVIERYEQGDGAWLNVWALAGSIGADRAEEVVMCLDELAGKAGARAWRFSGRHGWGRALGGMVKPVATVYERELHA